MTHFIRTLGLASASLFLFVSCQSMIGNRVDDLGKLTIPTKAYIILKIDNQTGKGFLMTRGDPTVYISKAFVEPSGSGLALRPSGDNPYLVYEVTPGTFRMTDFIVDKVSMVSNTRFFYTLTKADKTFFKVNPGEVVYMGTFTMIDKDDTLSSSFNLDKVKDELIAKYPSLEGFHWVGLDEDRPSF